MTAPRIPFQPALDGIRGVGVTTILLFHAHVSWAQGAFLSLSTFFTLSGYLITRLLLVEHERSGRVRLGRFWARRMRRLMPASLLTLAGVVLYGALVASEDQLARLRGDVLWTLAYLANWRFVLTHYHYTALFVAPSPVLHFWSLGIEEQFYAIYPVLVAGVLALAAGSRRALGAALAALVVASTALSAALYASGASVDRVYFGTDTRAAEFLVGCLLAVILSHLPTPGSRVRRGINAAGAAALAVSVVLWMRASLDSTWPYRGGLFLYAVLSALVIAASVQPASLVRTLLSWRPLVWIGRISYGIYLFHWPIFLWLSPERTGLGAGPLLALRLALVFGLADLSYRFFEYPIRSGRALTAWRPWLAAPTAAAVMVGGLWWVTLGAAQGAFDFEEPSLAHDDGSSLAATAGPRVAVFGDSTGLRLAWGVARWLRDTERGRFTRGMNTIGCGLADDGLFRSRRRIEATSPRCTGVDAAWARSIQQHDPDVAVVLFGHWDLHTRRLPGDGRWRAPGDPVFDDYLRDELHEAVDLLASRGALVVWLTNPAIDPRQERPVLATHERPERAARYNELLYELAAARPDEVRVVDLAGYLERRARDPAAPRLRPDGVHLSHEGAYELMAGWLGPEILRAYAAWAPRDVRRGGR